MSDEIKMPFGRYKGMPLSEISDGYLLALYDAKKLSGQLKEYVEERIPVLKSTIGNKKGDVKK